MTAARDRNHPPSHVDLKHLSHWARVAFATRCARRLQPLFLTSWPQAPRAYVEAIETAISLSEAAARAGRADPFLKDVAVSATSAADAARDTYATNSARVAAHAAHVALVDPEAPWTARVVGDAAKVVTYAAAYAIVKVGLLDATHLAVAAMWSDVDTLVRVTKERGIGTDGAVDPDWCGVLWPAGQPDWMQSPDIESLAPPLALEIDPGDAPEELIAEYLGALSNLFHASGGIRLRFKQEGIAIAVIAEVPA